MVCCNLLCLHKTESEWGSLCLGPMRVLCFMTRVFLKKWVLRYVFQVLWWRIRRLFGLQFNMHCPMLGGGETSSYWRNGEFPSIIPLRFDHYIIDQDCICCIWWWGGRVGLVVRALACLPAMWPEFDFRTRCHMWIEFIGSLLCYERFFPGCSGFSLSSKTSIWLDLWILIVK